MKYDFIKMHGLGNDFVIFDGRIKLCDFSADEIRNIANRRFGVGCDQVIIINSGQRTVNSEQWTVDSVQKGGERLGVNKEPSASEAAPHVSADRHAAGAENNVFMQIYNADGSEVASCGNATRCVAWLLMEESGKDKITIETKAGLLNCTRIGKMDICADMGEPKTNWQDIPLAKECDTMNLPISEAGLSNPMAVSMGNPHLIFAVDDVREIDIAKIGSRFEHHELFPERTNVSFAQIISPDYIKLRVWERGAGETLACGTAACATLVALHNRKLVSHKATINLPGGVLHVELDKTSGHVLMSGAVVVSFKGAIEL